MLVTLAEVLEIAEKDRTAIPSFNIDNIEGTMAFVEAAESENCPLILTIGQAAIRTGALIHLSDLVKRIADTSKVPIVLHLDHSTSYEEIMQCIRLGFSSVMYDGSHGSFEDNIKMSQLVAKSAHAAGISVEFELGAVGGVEDGISNSINLVDLNEVKEFIANVDCDALAVGIGNAHGMYKGTPNLDFDRLKACTELGTPPLVLHGGSGTPDEMIKKAIEIGIRKVNVATEFRMVYMESIEATVGNRDFYAMNKQAREKIKELAVEKIRLCQRK